MSYYYFDGKQTIGPLELTDLVKRPGFSAATLVFPNGERSADAWKVAGSFPDIVKALQSKVFPMPPPPASPAKPTAGLEPPPPQNRKQQLLPDDATTLTDKPELAQPATKLILVVDDDADIRNFIGMSLTMEGFRVVTASDGINAKAKLKHRTVDLIVTDLMMPGQGGYEFLRDLQGSEAGNVPVFVVSGSALDTSTIALIRQEANVVAFIPKPVDLDNFLAILHKHLKTIRPSPRAIPKRDGSAW